MITAAHCVAIALLLAYIPHWIRAFGYVRPKLGSKFDVRYRHDRVFVLVPRAGRVHHAIGLFRAAGP